MVLEKRFIIVIIIVILFMVSSILTIYNLIYIPINTYTITKVETSKCREYIKMFKNPICGYNCIYEPSWTSSLLYVANATLIRIKVLVNETFGNVGFNPRNITICIPEGSYSRALLQINVSISGGFQYDRVLWIYINGAPVFWGSTSQLRMTVTEVDISHFLKILRGCINFSIILSNWIIPEQRITGVYYVNISLLLFPGVVHFDPPDLILPLWIKRGLSLVMLDPTNASAIDMVKLPRNVSRVMLLIYAKGSRADEFFYKQNISLRDILIYIDNILVGVAHLFPTIYAGGFLQYYWSRTTASNALSAIPELIDVTAIALPLLVERGVLRIRVEIPALREIGGDRRIDLAGALMVWLNKADIISVKILRNKSYYMRNITIEQNYRIENSSYSLWHESLAIYSNNRTMLITSKSTGNSLSIQLISDIQSYTHIQRFIREARSIIDGIRAWSFSSRGSYEIYLVRSNTTITSSESLKLYKYLDSIRVLQQLYLYDSITKGIECFDTTSVNGSYIARVKDSKIIGIESLSSTTSRQMYCNTPSSGVILWVEAISDTSNKLGIFKSYNLVFWVREY